MKFVAYVTLGMIVGGLISLLFGVSAKAVMTGIFYQISMLIVIWVNLKIAHGTLVFKDNE